MSSVSERILFPSNQIQEKLDKKVSRSSNNASSDDACEKLVKEIEMEDEEDMEEKDLLASDYRYLGSCVTLLRNVLHIPDETPSGGSSPSSSSSNPKPPTRHNQILWNLFSSNLDTIIMRMIRCPGLSHW